VIVVGSRRPSITSEIVSVLQVDMLRNVFDEAVVHYLVVSDDDDVVVVVVVVVDIVIVVVVIVDGGKLR